MKHKFKQLITLIGIILLLGHHSIMAAPTDENNNSLIGFSQENYSVNEDSLSATITVERTCLDENAMPTAVVWYHTSYASSTATLHDDYSGLVAARKLRWQEGECGSKSVEIPIIDDSEIENDETVVITLSNPSGAKLNEQNRAVLTITDNDKVIIGFVQKSYRIDENAQSVTILVGQKGCGPLTEQFSVSYATNSEGGTATLDEDYSAITGTLTWGDEIGNNKYCGPRWFNVPILDDTVFEGNETIFLELGNPIIGAQFAQSEAVLTIIDDEVPSTITPANENDPGFIGFYQKDYHIDEAGSGNRGALIWVERFGCGAKTPPVSVSYATSPGTATAGEDYQTVTDSFSWEANHCGSKWFEVPITNDTRAENSETVSLKLSEPTGGAKLVQSETLLTIIDNDGSTIGFSQENYSVNEGDKLATITVKRTDCTNSFTLPAASVWYLVYEGEQLAASKNDYQTSRGQLFWEANQCTPLTFEVPIVDDAEVEGDETLSLELDSLSGAKSSQNHAVLTIIDNEPLKNQIGTPGSRPMTVTMDLNQKDYTAEDTLRLDMTVNGIGEADLYIAIISPSGHLTTLSYPDKLNQLNTLQPYLSAINITGKQVYPVFNGQLPAGLALGEYTICGVLVRPNAVEVLNQENWIYWDCPTLTIHDFSPFQDTLQDGSLGPEMVWIPAGTFRMGDIQGGGYSDEQPVHEVSVARFAMGRYEVTFAEYDKFAEATGREKPDDRGAVIVL